MLRVVPVKFDHLRVDAAIRSGRDWAEVEGREHRTKVFGTQGTECALLKEQNNRVTIMPLSRIVALHREEA